MQTINTSAMHRILFTAFPTVQSLDLLGVTEVFADTNRQLELAGRPRYYTVQLAAPSAGMLDTSSGIPLFAALGLGEIRGRIARSSSPVGPGRALL